MGGVRRHGAWDKDGKVVTQVGGGAAAWGQGQVGAAGGGAGPAPKALVLWPRRAHTMKTPIVGWVILRAGMPSILPERRMCIECLALPVH